MKKLLLLLTIVMYITPLLRRGAGGEVQAQNPLVKQWDKRFGGTEYDWLGSFKQTHDGGYILSGTSRSDISGDKTQAVWGPSGFDRDFWIIKIDSVGNKLWDKDFGGTAIDGLGPLQQTTDKGYILGGTSFSTISGDKTQNIWGLTDYWIVKTDSLGNKLWDKDFGGTNYDGLSSVEQTSDGGYILAGYSQSNANGNKTQPTWGGEDYWIVKTDSLGILQWDRDFGGTDIDELRCMKQTFDGGYIFGGGSYSPVSGDKTQANWDPSGFTSDYWVVKTDSLGIKQWDKTFGGTSDDWLYVIEQTTDGGYLLGGVSVSGISGDKTQNGWGAFDYWIIKIDSLGNKQWDKDFFGGTGDDNSLSSITQTTDGGFLFTGGSSSNISGNKTENNLGLAQAWLVKTDSVGNLQWDKTIFTNGSEDAGRAIQTNDGCFAIATSTNGAVGGYKTQSNWDTTGITFDYWIIKFCDSTLTTSTGNINHASGFNVYPNPFDKEFKVQSLKFKVGQECAVKVYDIFGKEMYSNTHTTLNFKLQTLNWPNGIYFIEVLTDKERMVRKVVKQ